MTDKVKAIRGMNDILPPETAVWQSIEKGIAACMHQYAYQEIKLPVVENTQLFKRSIGEVTDIVEKEMYTFEDLNGDSISLRPEGTAGCVRACLEHGLLHNQQQKLWYMGPMFRHEKPQKGRYRQFWQLGVEALGFSQASIDIELIALSRRLFDQYDLAGEVSLEINSLGTPQERAVYREKLVEYFSSHKDQLDSDSQKRLTRNPLRILDSKNPEMRGLIQAAPKLIDALGKESKEQLDTVLNGLELLGIPYRFNPHLVRGLDYYSHVVFEWVTDQLGSQSTLCAGGRYDKLVELLGGKPCPAVGFAMGIERLILLMQATARKVHQTKPDIYFILTDEAAVLKALVLAENLRSLFPHLQIVVNPAISSFKSQFKRADKSGAKFAFILGADELQNQSVGIKNLRYDTDQITLYESDLSQFIEKQIVD